MSKSANLSVSERTIPLQVPKSVPFAFFDRHRNKATGNCYVDSIMDSDRVKQGLPTNTAYTPMATRGFKMTVYDMFLQHVTGIYLILTFY